MAHPIDGIVFFRVSNSGIIRKISSIKIGNQIGVLGIREMKKGILFVESVNNEGSLYMRNDLNKLELDAFMKLIETEKTQERIKHTLKTGKPLVN